ncbi:hypothetical protein EV215_1248 [Hypnocyclicus thermotrophus]|uniref:CASTOR ACT domain-containing protein n=1 Tax=Hypnocyclicus thermotrophus TaxID=1627895 RepID=A0AA46I5B5_9FUSO|nr:ACT domain-containing protein [Hypnocyclicus thermotrophus]TDT69719.1 hypothetical protein EV215_1248 [Hypnocyclicus thermotrophus]
MYIIKILDEIYSIYNIEKYENLKKHIEKSEFYSILKIRDNISIICKKQSSSNNENWRVLKIEDRNEDELIQVVANITTELANEDIDFNIVSAVSKDYILIKEKNFNKAIEILEKIYKIK